MRSALAMVAQEGIKGLYRGLSASYLGTVETALHLVVYEKLKAVIRTRLRQAPVRIHSPRYTGLCGLIPHMARSIPSVVITLGVYEFVLRLMGPQ
ncbi:hypothetical protein COCMIDRAFT_41854 [Bipolaris oryzae ATCC 44560]|uniref:Uncharacterized protein n=1 Tax=Bipolaris oryzae ATCC 44560 TaxID=930090 RepID=W6YPT5_COCMI|nr:uncharacterized protein COCMIDRAFT_41854 [Bipolaris oryzae ATCC 44560]EUC39655.1 hypothetical protein COCMIDRAFT_41854 [Bipolaris oryzae ATCC 44560]